jgi:hypothetical protein
MPLATGQGAERLLNEWREEWSASRVHAGLGGILMDLILLQETPEGF